jgi:hypothetical protein
MHRCHYCGHLSPPPRPPVDAYQRDAALQAMLSHFEGRRARLTGALAEISQRQRAAMASARRLNGVVMLVIGGLFLCFAAACLAGAVAMVVATPAPARPGHPASQDSPLGVLAFGLFWLALGGGLFFIGVRYLRADRRDQGLRERGVRGCATVRSYRESSLVVDGNRKFDLVLEVAIPGRPPFAVRQSDYVPHPGAVTTGAELPVFVNPDRPEDLMIDWFALS